ncbi:MAG: undecaprenyl-phosphate glucose phosphotransferase [Alphaproteobacteria bacterium]|nr:undecaprenyl-phosphate glucose phosphotransferase [Alphaproteobacteria bacterium]MBU1559337.1 undecaprenyl-phosphate glucose phosphotransferase [Alphaproteobacteria bacterium]MBU2304632.1 undecaprenyl-phosphate glucose phosphotransferase [Alphaproteobacteria bacterium]MBU2369981.1 undecaprenyl-phosphate glucose phosphotransferase [Alphaproteobacteria bacterium]
MFRVDTKQAMQAHASRQAAAGEPGRTLSRQAEAIIAAPVERRVSGAVVAGVAQVVEATLLAALGYGIYEFYVELGQHAFYIPVILASCLLANVLFNAGRTHRISAYRTVFSQTGRVLIGWTVVMTVLTVGIFFFKAADLFSRVWLASWYVSGAVLLVAYRLGLRALVMRWTAQGRLRRRTVIVGGGKDAESLIEQIRSGASNDIALLGLFDDRIDARSPDNVAGYPKLGKVADLIEFARRTPVDLVIVSMPLSAEKRVLHMLTQLWVLPVDIRLSAHMSTLKFTDKAYSYVGDIAVFDMADRPISDWNLVFKWVFDKLVAITALILLSPIMVATAIAIKLESRGPIFFMQSRHGFNNELIKIYKFRSMRTDMADQSAAKLVTKGDPRVTKVGRFIRKTSIDELPQLFNVLKGELSIVGPRPHALQAKAANQLYYEAVEGYFARHRVKPGMTGWAQINGWRGETDTIDKIMQRVNHDLYYIENWSILFDAYILVMTPLRLFNSENAY